MAREELKWQNIDADEAHNWLSVNCTTEVVIICNSSPRVGGGGEKRAGLVRTPEAAVTIADRSVTSPR